MGLGRLPRSAAELAEICALPTDTEDERLRKATFLLSVGITIILGLAWAGVFGVLGYRLAASIPFAYSILASLSLTLFIRTGRYTIFRSVHLFLMLVLPFPLQLSLGGFVPSGGIIMWSFVAPIGALVLAGTRHGVPWFGAFVALVALSGFLDSRVSGPAVSQTVVSVLFVLNISTLSGLVYLLLQYFMRGLERTRAALELEQEKSEQLLLNVLPEPIATRLKQGEQLIADAFSEVTVLFADIVDFTPMSSRLAPEQVVEMLNEVFSAFDELAEREGLEKIKTIGDAYMAVAGVPLPRIDHAEAVAEMALYMQTEALARNLEVRIGIDSGPVVAGVIGKKKFSYDLWGDTVNTAARMQSHGLPGQIQVTPRLHRRLKDNYRFQPRGPVHVKGMGTMEPYLLVGRTADVVAQPARD